MVEPFVAPPRPGRSFVARVLRRPAVGDALADLTGALASAEQVADVTEETIEAIGQAHQVDVHRKLRDELIDLYAQFAERCLRDRNLDDAEAASLAHLKHLFGIDDRRAHGVVQSIAERLFSASADEAISDGRLSAEERGALDRLVSSLRLDPALAERAYATAAQARLQRAANEATADDRVSPEEHDELLAISASLDVSIELNQESTAALERMRLYWVIENGEVPTIEPDINLPKSERCYFMTDVEWYEHRRVTTGVRYAGPSTRIRIAKGIYFRAGQVSAQRQTSDELRLIDSGPLYLTSKRLIFRGSTGNKNVRLNKILTFEPYSNGVDIQKDAGKSPFLKFQDDLDLFILLLDRAIRDAL